VTTKTAKHPTGQEIVFTEDDHRYVSDGVVYKSATSILKDYFPEFDQLAHATRIALKTDSTPEKVIAEWEAITKKATDHGTMVHGYLESLLLDKDPGEHSLTNLTVKTLVDISDKVKLRYDIFESEKIVFSPSLGLSGTMDLLGRRKDTGVYVVADWKTNKKMELENLYRKFGSGPFSKVPDNNFGHYSLQVHLYRELLVREEYVPKKAKFECIITHIPSIEDGVFRNYLAKDYSKEVKKLFKNILSEREDR
jgi:hypothetical protein